MPRSGRDRTPAALTEREVREHFLPPFRAAVAAGGRAVMVNSGEIDGVPVHASRRWLTDVLRGELGFRGVVVTDWEDVRFLHTRHHVAPTLRDAVRIAVDAGIDMSMTPNDFQFADDLVALVRDGVIAECRVDESVRRILTLKGELGLLDDPYPDPAARDVGRPASREVARRAARESITLLKNDGVLPLRRGARVLVAGPGAHSLTALNGGWTYTWQGADPWPLPCGVPTVLDAVRARAGGVRHFGAPGFAEPTDADVAAAAAAARDVDAAVVVLGESGYAEWVGDVDDLTLPPSQLRLAAAVQATGTPTVLVLLEGRPRIVRDVADGASAIVMGYWPGMEGGEAVAEVLFGEVNPSGRLPFTYPRHPNALTTYDHKHTEALTNGLVRGPGGFDPQFEFGHGLAYTTFAYRNLRLDRTTLAPGDDLGVEVTVTNTGGRDGQEAVLLFTRQHYASITPPVRRLRDFAKVALAPGESRAVRFTLRSDDLTYVGHNGKPVLEPGAFDVMVGGLTATFAVIEPR